MENVKKVIKLKNDLEQEVDDILAKLKYSSINKIPNITLKDLDFIYKCRKLFKFDVAVVMIRKKDAYNNDYDNFYFLLIEDNVCKYQIELVDVSLKFEKITDEKKGIILKDNNSISYINLFECLYVADGEPKFLGQSFQVAATALNIYSHTRFVFKNCIGLVYNDTDCVSVYDTNIGDLIINHNQQNIIMPGFEFSALNALCKAHNINNQINKLIELSIKICNTIQPDKDVNYNHNKILMLKRIYAEFNSLKENNIAFEIDSISKTLIDHAQLIFDRINDL